MAKSNPLFDTLNYICTKQYKWEELPDDCRKNYSQFMINRFLSSYEYLIPLVNELSISKTLSDKQHYTILYTWVKRTKHYFNYNAYKASKTDTNLVIAVKKEYGVGNREAARYIGVLTEEIKEKLKAKWTDYIRYISTKS